MDFIRMTYEKIGPEKGKLCCIMPNLAVQKKNARLKTVSL